MEETKKTLKPSKKDKDVRRMTLIEAALYVSGRPLDLKTLCSVLKTRSKKKVQQLARKLAEEYASRNTALEILELNDERFVLQLKAEYTPQVRKLAVKPLLSIGPLKTLSYIAYRQPVPQRRVIQVRGSHAYEHIRQLEELGLVKTEKTGKSKVLKTTEYFADYFGLSHDIRLMKKQLKSMFEGVEAPQVNKAKKG